MAVCAACPTPLSLHCLQSYTAIPYQERVPRPQNPLQRPAYQGRNPISDVFSLWALKQTVKYLPRVAKDPMGDTEARGQMLLAATFAGIGFGNAGVHLCHGISYPISGLNKTLTNYYHPGYKSDHPLIPHGLSVCLTGPGGEQARGAHRGHTSIPADHAALSQSLSLPPPLRPTATARLRKSLAERKRPMPSSGCPTPTLGS